MTLSFFVPGLPIPKGRARVVTRGGKAIAFTPERTRNYERLVALYATRAVATNRSWPKDAPMSLAVRLRKDGAEVTLTTLDPGRKRRIRGDLDNITKALTDAMNGITYADDRQLCQLAVEEDFI